MHRINLLKGMPGRKSEAIPAAEAGQKKSGGYAYVLAVVIAVVIIGGWAYMKGGQKPEETMTLVRLKEPPPPSIAPQPPVMEESKAPSAPRIVEGKAPPVTPAVETRSVPEKEEPSREEGKTLNLPSGRLPVALHVASYSMERSARNDVRRMRGKGHDAFMSIIEITGKGTWFRVFSGRYGSTAKAKAAGAALKGEGLIEYAKPMKLPYSLQVGLFSSPEKAAGSEEKLNLLGYPATVLKVEGDDHLTYYRLLVGAFQSKKASEEIATGLKNDGYQSVLTSP